MIVFSLDSNIDPTKPDLLGHIADNVQSENAKNLQNGAEQSDAAENSTTENGAILGGENAATIPNGDHSNGVEFDPLGSNGELEKGALDSLSNKSDGSIKSSLQR